MKQFSQVLAANMSKKKLLDRSVLMFHDHQPKVLFTRLRLLYTSIQIKKKNYFVLYKAIGDNIQYLNGFDNF